MSTFIRRSVGAAFVAAVMLVFAPIANPSPELLSFDSYAASTKKKKPKKTKPAKTKPEKTKPTKPARGHPTEPTEQLAAQPPVESRRDKLFADSRFKIHETRNHGNRLPEETRTPRDKVLSHEVFVALPDNTDSFAKVFGKQPSRRDISEMRSANKQLSRYKNRRQQDLYRYIEASRSDIISIIGHNEDGKFRLTNGHSLSLIDILDKCEKSRKICIFLTCRARSHFTSSRRDYTLAAASNLTFKEAAGTAGRIDRYIRRNLGHSQREVIDNLPATVASALAYAHLETQIAFAATLGAAGTPPILVGVLVETQTEQPEDTSDKPSETPK